mgnify:CR=1 FL=1
MAGGFLRAAGVRTLSGGGCSFLGPGNIEDGGGRMHQSMSPRCSELRKSFRISQRIAPVPRLFTCQDLRSCPFGTLRPSPRQPKGPPCPGPEPMGQSPSWPVLRTHPRYLPLLTFLTTCPDRLRSIRNTICMKRATSSHASLLSGIRSMLIWNTWNMPS